jgi:cell growth-regulating nucleolar protein
VNVFDFLVDDETPNASSVALATQSQPPAPAHHQQQLEYEHQRQLQSLHHDSLEPMAMVQHAAPVFDNPSRHLSHSPLPFNPLHNSSKETFGERSYDQTGFHYGQGPVPVSANAAFLTPAPHRDRERSSRRTRDENGLRTSKKDSNKRKRVHIDDLDLSAATAHRRGSSSVERGVDDEMMVDAPLLPELHTGLTGGLNRLLSSSRHPPGEFPPSPDYSGDNIGESPGSPLTRNSRHSRALAVTATALVRTKKPSTSSSAADREHRRLERSRDRSDRDERRARKKHRKHRRRSSSVIAMVQARL